MSTSALVKHAVKKTATPVLNAMWPLVEGAASLSAQYGTARRGLKIVWTDRWNGTFDEALDTFAPPPGCSMDQYRALLEPTAYLKRHALVLESDTPIALVSLRRRGQFWEPVSYQSITGFIAPAKDSQSLGRSLRALGLDIRIGAGLDESIFDSNPTSANPYDTVRINLRSDYEAYWDLNKGKHRQHINIARKKCKNMHAKMNDSGDMEWTVNTWHNIWKDSPEQETVAAPDRIRFWNTLKSKSGHCGERMVHTYTLYDGDIRVAGLVMTSMNGVVIGQCIALEPKYRSYSAGTRIQDIGLQQAAKDGFEICDLGGGFGYKSLWGPVEGQRYTAEFRPSLFDKLSWAQTG